MRSLIFILALAFLCAGISLAGPRDGSLPGVGTFIYSGSHNVSGEPSVIFAER